MRAIVLVALMCMLICRAHGQENVIWQIGQADNDYKEFAIAGNHGAFLQTFPNDVTFRAGKDDPAKAWPFIQPGPSDNWAGGRAHPFTIIFDLPDQPVGTFTLTIDLVNTHYSGPPRYEIMVNGKGGVLHLPQGGGDESLTDPSKGRELVISLPLPASLFRQGENQIVLTSVEGSWLIFDALKLANAPQGTIPEPGIKRITLTPTVLLVKQDSGLKQILRLTAEFSPGAPKATATVKVGDKSQEVAIEPDLMGSAACEVLVDEVAAPTKAEASIETQTATCDLAPQKHWKIYLQPSAHVDIGYTDFQERVVTRHNENMTLALDLCDKHPDFKWNTEAAWVEDNYLSMVPGRKAGFIRLAKEGRIGCQAIYGNMLTGICSHESFIRDLYFARSVAKEYGIPYDIAMSSDVPTQVWTLPTVLAGSGIKYYSAGLNLTRGDSFNRLFGKSPFYWQGPDGSKVLTWLSPGYAYAANLGLNIGVRQAESRIEGFLNGFNRPDYPYDAVLAFGGFSDNQPLDARLASVADEWNEKYAYPQVILCRGPEFFQYMEANFKAKIQTISGDGGVYWEDGAGSSAMETALVRQAKESLVAAEKLFALIGAESPKADLDLAWKNAILYDEHTWGAHCSISQPDSEQTVHQWKVKAQFAYDASDQAESLVQRGLNALAASVKPSVVVFNPLSWPVSGPVSVIRDGEPVEFWADDVPPVGYRTYPVSSQPPAASSQRSAGLENRFYRVSFDPVTGAVTSLYDKDLKRELVDAKASYGINQYIYMKGLPNAKDVTRDANTPKATMTLEARPYGSAMVIENAGAMTLEFTTEVILYDKIKRIDFINKIFKDDTLEKEAGYFAFPFALNKPEFYVELPDGVVRPKRQMLDGACMQWYCLQDFVAVADDKTAVVWTAVDSPLFTIGDINRDTFKSPLPIENGHLYAYVFNNYWFTNYKAGQDGDLTFRFALTSMPKYDPVAASRFGQSVRNPLMAVVGTAAQGKMPSEASFCLVKPSNVVVQAVKRAESGKGTIIRLRELAGKKTRATLALPKNFTRAWACNLVEDPQSALKIGGGKVTVTVPANGLCTVLAK